MIIAAEVKCLNCSRVCGEIEGVPLGPISFEEIRPYGEEWTCPPIAEARIRCSRCGGSVYLDEVREVKPPLLDVADALEPKRRRVRRRIKAAA